MERNQTTRLEKNRPMSFEELGLDEWISNSCQNLAMHKPTAIQSVAIPVLLSGKDAVICSPTGSGKTLCFGLPILQALAKDPFGVFCVIITPVRELAHQIQQQLAVVGHFVNLKTCLVVGGKSSGYQSNIIVNDRPHIVIATPGRLADMIRTSPDTLRCFSRVRWFIMDEADRLLSGSGFEQDLLDIIALLPVRSDRQTVLVTATISRKVRELQAIYGESVMPLLGEPANPNAILNSVKHEYVLVPSLVRLTYLHHLLRNVFPSESIIIFTRTIMSCQVVASAIERFMGEGVACLHSMLEGQSRRFAALGKFRNQHARILVATDVAARGLDIPAVNVVINFELPTDTPNYTHRVGRTGRAGRLGRAISLVSESEIDLLHAIEKATYTTLEQLTLDENTVLLLLSKTSVARREAESMLNEIGFEDKIKQRRQQKRSRLVVT